MQYYIGSSHARFTIDETGKVIERDIFLDSEEQDHMAAIERFDLDEWRIFWGRILEDSSFPASFDILDLGYWYKEGKGTSYSPPDFTWRRECGKQVHTGDLFPFPYRQPSGMTNRRAKFPSSPHTAELAKQHKEGGDDGK